MSKLELIELCVLGVCVLALFVFYLIKAIKNKWVSNILNTINKAIKEAETSGKTGLEKKAYVVEQAVANRRDLRVAQTLWQHLVDTRQPTHK